MKTQIRVEKPHDLRTGQMGLVKEQFGSNHDLDISFLKASKELLYLFNVLDIIFIDPSHGNGREHSAEFLLETLRPHPGKSKDPSLAGRADFRGRLYPMA